MKASVRALLITLFAAVLPRPAVAQEWSLKHYDSQHGLPQNSVRAMEMTAEGYLWITTEGGLVRFDGNGMRTYSRLREPIITSDRFVSLMRSATGELYTVTEARTLYRISGNNVSLLEAQGSGMGMDGCVPGTAFFRKAFGAGHLLEGRSEWPGPVRILQLPGAEYAVPATNTILVYKDTTLVRRIPSPGAGHQFFLLDGRMYTLDAQGLFTQVDAKDGGTRVLELHGLPDPLMALPPDRWKLYGIHGNVLLRVDQQVYRIVHAADTAALDAHLLLDGLVQDQFIVDMMWVPEENVLLVGTSTTGLYLYTRQHMQRITTGPNEGPLGIYAQLALGNDRVLTGYRHSIEMGRTGRLPSTIPDLVFNERMLLKDGRGRIWYTDLDTIFRFTPPLGARDTFLIEGVTVFGGFLEEGDSVWVGSDQGIGCIKDDKFRWTCRYAVGTERQVPVLFRRGPDGQLWFASCAGVFRMNAAATCMKPLPQLLGRCARALQLVGDRMLIGTYGDGMFIWERERCLRLPRDQQDFLAHAHAFMPDSAGAIWISANQGLFRMMRKGLDSFMQDTTYNIYFAHFGEQAGLGGVEFNGGCDPAYVRMPDGTASFPTLDGLVWFHPEAIPDPFPRRSVQVDGIQVDNRIVAMGSTIELPSDYREFEVHLSLAYWGELANAQIEYRLPGRQDNWQPLLIGERMVRFRRLPFGDYTFSVRKVGALGNDDPRQLDVRFTVLPPYYRTNWFYALCVLTLLSIGYLVLRLNEARLRRTNIALERSVRERTKELQQANQGLRHSLGTKEMLVSIISHDIVTPLRFISRVASGAARSGEKGDVTGSLRDISMSTAKLYANAQNVLNWIKHQDRRIELRPLNVAMNPLAEEVLAMVQEHASSRNIRLLNDVPLDDIERTDRDVLSIILQNLVNNAVNHTEHSDIRISATGSEKDYRITVSDTGGGMSPKALEHVRRLTGSDRGAGDRGDHSIHGLGYVIITELLQLLGASMEIDSTERTGTRVTLVFPRVPAR